MTISINTSDYKKQVEAEIDGINFVVRPMTSGETIAYMELTHEMAAMADVKEVDEKAIKKVTDSLDNALDMFANCFDKKDEAKKIFADVPMEKWLTIYNKIVKGEE